jgi:RNA polymerase sigma-70 factor, ECF subfamily
MIVGRGGNGLRLRRVPGHVDQPTGSAGPGVPDAPGPPDDEQGDRLAARNEAFAQYVLPEVDVLLRVARTLTQQPVDAEDLVQDTLVRAFRAGDRFDGAHPRAWLLTILRNTHLNRVRVRRPALLDDPQTHEEDRVSWPGTPPPTSPEDLVLGEVFDHAVAQALNDLPEVFAAAVRLVDLDGLSYAEAAGVLGVPVGTVMSRLHRGRARIRASLTRAGVAPSPSRVHARTVREVEAEGGREPESGDAEPAAVAEPAGRAAGEGRGRP